MSNCIVAQSGGPSSVINATIAGIIKANQLNPIYEHVYGGLNGIEGVLAERFVDLTDLSEHEIRVLCQTPSSVLGSCRYKLHRKSFDDLEQVMAVMQKYEADVLFYIGGNDSMDTVAALSEYAAKKGQRSKRFIGCPKSVDNDLFETDHSPGFGSAAKFIAVTALECWQDLNVYPESRKEVFITETMGRDAGWLAASACLSNIVDVLIVPEKSFDRDEVLKQIRLCVEEKSKCFVVISEGAHYADGTYVSASEARSDMYGHAVLGGAARALEQMILEEGIAPRCKIMDLSSTQRCHALDQSLTDVTESFDLGQNAHTYSADPSVTGRMIAMKRKKDTEQYEIEFTTAVADKVANYVRNFPSEWLKKDYKGITEEADSYMRPLIMGNPEILMKDGLPDYILPYYMRNDSE